MLALLRLAAAAALGLSLVACEERPAAKPAPSASAVAAVDVEAYCNEACGRAARCGLEEAEKLVRSTPAEQARWAEMQAESANDELSCAKECLEGAADERATGPMREIERCLEQTSCETFRGCLAREPDVPPAAEARR